jgi:hypothetical protein
MDTIAKEKMSKTSTSKKVSTTNAGNIQLNVPISFLQIVNLIKQLSSSEKQQLSEILWAEQNIDDMAISEEHKLLVRERVKKYENCPESYLSWEDIEHKMIVHT